MNIEFDSNKNEVNIAKHGISLADAQNFIWETATVKIDARFEYGEARYKAQGFIGKRLYTLIFTLRDETYRIISLRKSNIKESKHYEKT
ncbi:MAG: BrnT family toxin [Pseudomonadota bacterium]